MEKLPIPDFLADKSVEQLHQQMLAILPENMDKSQGQHVYNLIRPTALIAAELCQQAIPKRKWMAWEKPR